MLRRGNSPTLKRAGRLVRPARLSLCAAALAMAAALVPASPAVAAIAAAAQLAPALNGQGIEDFYAARAGRPLWLREDGSAGIEPMQLLDVLRTADADGLDPGRYRVEMLADALRRAAWGGSPQSVAFADRMLSEAFVAYVRDLKREPPSGIHWVDATLRPAAPSPRALLEAAAAAPSLEAWIGAMGWMNPIYAGLRDALVHGRGDPQLLRLNLERARALPAGRGRYVLVNATAARLAMYEDGREVDSMKVVVGRPKHPTPLMAALIRYTSLNPYWYVPPDLAAERVAPNVVKHGISWLKANGYQLMTGWDDGATELDPAGVDWQAVADGGAKVWLRQLPGPGNAMGQMKFMFPNGQGIYLHDTPQKELLAEASRLFSGGCVRLEDAQRLARWLYGRPLQPATGRPEERVDLPQPVPVYITYLTVIPEGTQLATYPDVYGRDRDQLAALGSFPSAAR